MSLPRRLFMPCVLPPLSTVHVDMINYDAPFRPVGLVVPHKAATSILIADIQVGRTSQMGSVGSTPGEIFSDKAEPDNYYFDVVETGMTFTVAVTNKTNASAYFAGSVFYREPSDPKAKLLGATLFGLGNTTVPAGDGIIIHMPPRVEFEPCRLFVPTAVLEAFTIDRVTSVDAKEGRIRAEVPASLLTLENLSIYGVAQLTPNTKVGPGQYLTVAARNTSAKVAFFQGAFAGQKIG